MRFMVRFNAPFTVLCFILLLLLVIGCRSSQKNAEISRNEIPDLVTLSPPPEDIEHVESTIYVDSVKRITIENSRVLLIQGDFPDGCTSIGRAGYDYIDGTAELTLYAWRNPNMLCSQALVPFSFIYSGIPDDSLKSIETIYLNGNSYSLD